MLRYALALAIFLAAACPSFADGLFGGTASTVTPGALQAHNNVVYAVDYFTPPNNFGGDRVNACLAAAAALGGPGGVCDARGFTGNIAAYNTIVIPADTTLLLGGGATIGAYANPGITYVSGSKIIGLSRTAATINCGFGPGQICITNANTSVAANNVVMENFTMQVLDINDIGFNLVFTSSGRFYNIQLQASGSVPKAGTIGFNVDGNVICSCSNIFETVYTVYLDKSLVLKNGGNANIFMGANFTRGNLGVDLVDVSGNVFIGGDMEDNFAAPDIQFDSGALGNAFYAQRFEENQTVHPAMTNLVLNNATFQNRLVDAYDQINGGTITSYVDNTGTLTWNSNRAGLIHNGGVVTISSGFCTSPSVNSNGAGAFDITVGSACAGSTGTVTLPAAQTGWVCNAHNITNTASNVVEQTGGTTTTATFTNYVRTTGVAGNFTAADHIRVSCNQY